MRPNQQSNKNRSRGRNNNGGRKHTNPLSRNYESNGPDGKVRGNAAHVAEKYLQLARDAQSSGDSVMAENFLQHAEHYFRIVASAQQQNQPRDQVGQSQQDNSDDDDDFTPINDRFASPEPVNRNPPQQNPPQQNQPQQDNQPAAGGDAAEAGATAEASGSDGEGQSADGEGPRRRDRRGRRRRGAGEQGGAEQSADGPQPEVGDLPAFLTAATPAAE